MGFILRHSCALTLSRKLRLRSRKKTFKKFGKLLQDPETNTKLAIPDDFKPNKFLIKSKTDIQTDPLKIMEWSLRTHHLMQGPCVNCGATKNIEIHHIRKLKKKNPKLKGIDRIMSTLNRKQVPLCSQCHKNIHRGTYDGVNLRKSKD